MSETQIVQMLKAGQNDLQWFDSNLDRLISKFNNKFIAFKSEDVIDSDPELNTLMLKLKKKNIDTSNIFIKFVSRVKSIL